MYLRTDNRIPIPDYAISYRLLTARSIDRLHLELLWFQTLLIARQLRCV